MKINPKLNTLTISMSLISHKGIRIGTLQQKCSELCTNCLLNLCIWKKQTTMGLSGYFHVFNLQSVVFKLLYCNSAVLLRKEKKPTTYFFFDVKILTITFICTVMLTFYQVYPCLMMPLPRPYVLHPFLLRLILFICAMILLCTVLKQMIKKINFWPLFFFNNHIFAHWSDE